MIWKRAGLMVAFIGKAADLCPSAFSSQQSLRPVITQHALLSKSQIPIVLHSLMIHHLLQILFTHIHHSAKFASQTFSIQGRPFPRTPSQSQVNKRGNYHVQPSMQEELKNVPIFKEKMLCHEKIYIYFCGEKGCGFGNPFLFLSREKVISKV